MMKSLRTLIVAGSCLALTAACSLKKTAEDTAKTTKEMNETTKEMNESTKDLKGTSEELKDMTGSLGSNMTYDVSHARMTEHLDRLFYESNRDNTGVVGGTWNYLFGNNDDPDMLAEAGFTIYAMYFQFWEGRGKDDVAELDERLEVGIELLFDRMFKHIPRNGDVNGTWILRPDYIRPGTSFKGVAAIGAKMDDIHTRYVKGLERQKLPRMSLYDYVIQALRNRDAVTRTEKTPKAIAKILQWEHEAVYTLQLRHNILPVMVMARITDFQDRKDGKRLWMWWKGQKVSLSKANPEQLKEWTSWLNKASQTRKDLRALGIEPQYNKMLTDLVAGIDFGQNEILANTTPSARQMLERDFAAAFVKAVKESKPSAPEARPEAAAPSALLEDLNAPSPPISF